MPPQDTPPSEAAGPGSPTPAISMVIPTYNERENIPVLAARLHEALDGTIAWEAIVVDDDSPDGTAALVAEMGARDSALRVIHRRNERGIASACRRGFDAARAPVVGVMDADLQHDPAVIPQMYATLQTTGADIVSASRYMDGSVMDKQWSPLRLATSRVACWMARMAMGVKVTDPQAGFMLLPRTFYEEVRPNLSGEGFKIFLDLIAASPRPVRLEETPYVFHRREVGESKFGSKAMWDFAKLMAKELFRSRRR